LPHAERRAGPLAKRKVKTLERIMPIPLFCIDAFTNKPFHGNPAAVCLLSGPCADAWMQAVAAEMNLSETAFVLPRDDGAFGLRWFTPATEVDLCGHATLAAAHALWEASRVPSGNAIRFQTRSGELVCNRRGEWIELDFPALVPTSASPPAGLLDSLGVATVHVSRSRFDYLVQVKSEQEVRAARPDFRALRAVDTRGVILTAASAEPAFDLVSRFFAPAVGVDEDPVTGSAHCCLAVYWSRLLGRSTMIARQLSLRGGIVRVELRGDRVILGGQAVTVHKGELLAVE
jgi:PhzF family phenazine biosynthesis protein